MEFFVYRALDVARLNYEQLTALHVYENNRGRCFAPFETTDRFKCGTIKQAFGVPEANNAAGLSAQARYHVHVRNLLTGGALAGVTFPKSGADVTGAHQFDQAVFEKVDKLELDFGFNGMKGKIPPAPKEPVAAGAPVERGPDRRDEPPPLWSDV